MTRCPTVFVLIASLFLDPNNAVSSKMDFGEETSDTVVNTNSTNTNNEDVEVKHTITVTTKLKNNNHKGFHSNGDPEPINFYRGRTEKPKKESSGEVQIVGGYKALDSTRIYAEDTRNKPKIYPDAFFVNRNIRDENDVFPEVALTPNQWKPSSFFKNINFWNTDGLGLASTPRNYPKSIFQAPRNFNRKITDEGMRDFYCNRCRAMSNGQVFNGCSQQRTNWIPTTTPKLKLDGKLAKLN